MEGFRVPYFVEEEMVSKIVKEYPLPASSQTHEMVKVGEELLLFSQQPNSAVVKVALEAHTARPLEGKKFTLGGSSSAGLHGLFVSKTNPGQVWVTLQFLSKLMLLDPVADRLHAPPKVIKLIHLPGGPSEAGWGPHTLVEDGDDLWVACKGSNYVLRVSQGSSSILASYQCSGRPIFVAIHPQSRDVYSSLDMSSRILRLQRMPIVISGFKDYKPTMSSQEIDIPKSYGNTPVGLVAGPDGNVWFVLLGDSSGGNGTFARISSDGSITWFQLTCAVGARAGLIHLAFDPSYAEGAGVEGGPLLRVWLLASSMACMTSVNAIFSVTLDGKSTRIACEKTILMPTPMCMTHRVLVHGKGLFVTELGVSILAHIEGSSLWSDVLCETSDPYSLWGFGCAGDDIVYSAAIAKKRRETSGVGPSVHVTNKIASLKFES